MRWIGLDWDEGPEVGGEHGPYFQSQRLARYRELGEQFVRDGHAYYCYCGSDTRGAEAPRLHTSSEWSPGSSADAPVGPWSPGSLDPGEEGDTPRGESWTYDRRCSRLTPEEVAAREAAKMPRAIRFRVPPGETTFHDLVHGDITFDNVHIEDFVALRSDGHPAYHLSVVADDIDMAITHVVRDSCAASKAFTAAALEPAIRALADARGVKAGVLIHPTRVAVVGRAESPGIFEVLELLGRERALARMAHALRAFQPQG